MLIGDNTVITVIGGGFYMEPTTSQEAKELLERAIESFEEALESPISQVTMDQIARTSEAMFNALDLFVAFSLLEMTREMAKGEPAQSASENGKH